MLLQLVYSRSVAQNLVNNSLSFPPLKSCIIDFTSLDNVPVCLVQPQCIPFFFSGIIFTSTPCHSLKVFIVHLLCFPPKQLFHLSSPFCYYCLALIYALIMLHRWLLQNSFFFLFLQTLSSPIYLHTTVVIILEPKQYQGTPNMKQTSATEVFKWLSIASKIESNTLNTYIDFSSLRLWPCLLSSLIPLVSWSS